MTDRERARRGEEVQGRSAAPKNRDDQRQSTTRDRGVSWRVIGIERETERRPRPRQRQSARVFSFQVCKPVGTTQSVTHPPRQTPRVGEVAAVTEKIT